MRPVTRRPPARPAAVVVGTWDPLLPVHHDLIRQLQSDCAERDLAPLLVLLEPDPRVLGFGAARWPEYHDYRSRVAALLDAPVAVIVLRFERWRDIRTTPARFFEILCREVRVAELWLGDRQTLGSGSTPETIAELADKHAVKLRALPPSDALAVRNEIRGLLADGRVRAARALAGHPPARRRPRSGVLHFAWPPGSYRARVYGQPGTEFTVELVRGPNKLAYVNWPPRLRASVEFVSGPGD